LTRRLRRQADNAGAPWAALPVVLVVLGFVGCGGGGEKASSSPCPTRGAHVSFPLLDDSKPHTIHVLTNFGSFDVRLDVEDSPCTTSSFAALVRKRFFDGTIFHRIVPGFVIQGGDPTGTGRGGPATRSSTCRRETRSIPRASLRWRRAPRNRPARRAASSSS
jgi:hypothetical protein